MKKNKKIWIFYRISNNSYPKNRLKQATKINCLLNTLNEFDPTKCSWELFGDGINEETQKDIDSILILYPEIKYTKINTGSGAASFNVALTEALKKDDEDIIHFVEDDYIWRHGSLDTLNEMMDFGVDYGTLYLCPDKFLAPSKGGNPFVDEDGGYNTKIYRGETQLFMLAESTTMTFFSKVKTLKEDEEIMRRWTNGSYPNDFKMFLELREKGRSLFYPLSSKATHAEIAWLAPINGLTNDELPQRWSQEL